MSTYQQRKIIRVRIMPTLSPRGKVKLQLVFTPQLWESTLDTRNLLASCAEARSEVLNHLGLVPDVLLLQGGGILRCDLSRDVIMIEDLSPNLFHQLDKHRRRSPVEHGPDKSMVVSNPCEDFSLAKFGIFASISRHRPLHLSISAGALVDR